MKATFHKVCEFKKIFLKNKPERDYSDLVDRYTMEFEATMVPGLQTPERRNQNSVNIELEVDTNWARDLIQECFASGYLMDIHSPEIKKIEFNLDSYAKTRDGLTTIDATIHASASIHPRISHSVDFQHTVYLNVAALNMLQDFLQFTVGITEFKRHPRKERY